MNRERLSYVLGKLVCWMRRGHSYGPKYKYSSSLSYVWMKKCLICGNKRDADEPKRRVERRA